MKQLLLFLLPTLLLGAVSRQYKVSDFTKLDISGPFKTVFSQTGTNSITVNADTERRADQIVVKQDGNTVYITTNVTDYQLGLGNLQVAITNNQLQNLKLSLVNSFSAKDLKLQANGVISLSNNSELNTTTLQGTDFRVLSDLTARLNVGKLTGREVRIEALQVSQVNALEGEVERLELRADGTSQVDLGRVRVGDAVLNAGEVSTIAVYVTNTAKANAVGVSRIFIAGNPKVEESKDMISEIVVGGTPGQKVDDMGSAGGKPRWEDYVDDDEGEWGGVFAPRTIGRTRWSEYANNGW